MKTLLFLFLLFTSENLFFQDVSEDLANAIRTSNTKEISKYFNDKIDLKVVDKEDVYSKAQAEIIIKDFFDKHAVKSFNLAHKSATSNGPSYAIGTLETANGNFRTYFLFKTIGEKTTVTQFRIELEN